ncbi:MAG: putative transporter [Alphaproteobacteria bacterium]|nr:putative transporter [Alphaproteobacteria bacterium]
MLRCFFLNREWRIWAYGVGALLIGLLWMQVSLTVMLNEWYREFYDLLQKAPDNATIEEFWVLIIQFSKIAGFYVPIGVLTSYITRVYSLCWRQAMTFYYIPWWQKVDDEIEGASQRIQEDTYRFARIVEGLGLQVARAIMTLIAFLPILWQLSTNIVLPYFGEITGSLVGVTLILTIGGLAVSWFVGIKLPGLEYNNQKVEAAFRKELVYGEDDKLNYVQNETLIQLFTGIRLNYHRLFLHYAYFDLWVTVYNQFVIIVPLLLMGPSIIAGIATLGVALQASNAFDKVHGAFSLFIDNWTTITELRSIVKRLQEFECNLRKFNPSWT